MEALQKEVFLLPFLMNIASKIQTFFARFTRGYCFLFFNFLALPRKLIFLSIRLFTFCSISHQARAKRAGSYGTIGKNAFASAQLFTFIISPLCLIPFPSPFQLLQWPKTLKYASSNFLSWFSPPRNSLGLNIANPPLVISLNKFTNTCDTASTNNNTYITSHFGSRYLGGGPSAIAKNSGKSCLNLKCSSVNVFVCWRL